LYSGSKPYLLKTEPNKYSFDDLLRDGETVWDGIANNQALMYLRAMKKGDKLVIYHSNIGKSAVGKARVLSVDATDAKNPQVRIAPDKRLKQAKTSRQSASQRSFRIPFCYASSGSPSSRSPRSSTISS